MFTNETTLYESGYNLAHIIWLVNLKKELSHWKSCVNSISCTKNWTMTFSMIVTNKHIKDRLQKEVKLEGTSVKIVELFK